jgi:hypothetical protein
MTHWLAPLLAVTLLATGCVTTGASSSGTSLKSKSAPLRVTGESIQIRLDERAPPYLVGKVLNLPQPISGDYHRLVSIPSWTCRGGVACEPCNDVAECDVMPPVEAGVTLLVEDAWIDEPGGKVWVKIISAYVSNVPVARVERARGPR